MALCETCGNEYEKSFQVVMAGKNYTFDSVECAIHKLAPAPLPVRELSPWRGIRRRALLLFSAVSLRRSEAISLAARAAHGNAGCLPDVAVASWFIGGLSADC